MIEKATYSSFYVICDICGYEEEIDADGDFYLLVELMKERGWVSIYKVDHWENICFDCVKNPLNERDE